MTITDRQAPVSVKADADPLAQLLAGRYADPETGAAVTIGTRSLVIEESLAGREAELVAGLDFGRRIAVISDTATAKVLGERVERALAGRWEITSLVLPANSAADDATVARLRAAAAPVDAFVAIGSGTINDLTKYASALEGKPYCVFATAPSMNGYVSLTASITVGGHKSTLPAQTPAGAFFDLDVLSAAPKRMIRAGLGDSICRTTAQADWLLSHLLLDTSYAELPFVLLQQDEAMLLAQVDDLLGGSLEAMRALTRTLVLSGFGTAIVGSSAPASQAEHLVSHYIDMLAPASRPMVFHGEQVGVTTLSIARLQRAMLGKRPVLHADTTAAAAIRERYGPELAGSVLEEFEQKRIDRQRAEMLNDRLASDWPTIRDRLDAVLLPVAGIEAALQTVGAPLTAADIHLDRGFYEAALRHAYEIRNRFTALDVAASSGLLDSTLSTL